MDALYVEIDDYAASWLENLVRRGVIARGDVHCGDMRDVRPRDLSRYNQVHLFAGIGVWSYALRRAGIPDDANVWTFSEPCQPFSAAGKGLGFADERYLRPYTHHLVTQCRPAICLGEQVASGDGLAWLDVVQSDMEDANYAGGAIDTCSAGFGAPHIRQRLRFAYASAEWLADTQNQRHPRVNGEQSNRTPFEPERPHFAGVMADSYDTERGTNASRRDNEYGTHAGWSESASHAQQLGGSGVMGHTECTGPQGHVRNGDRTSGRPISDRYAATPGNALDDLADAAQHGRGECRSIADGSGERSNPQELEQRPWDSSLFGHNGGPGPTNGHWRSADWLFCRDDKWRPVEPGTFPLAHGLPRSMGRIGPELRGLAEMAGVDGQSLTRAKEYRVGALKAYGNAVDGEATTEFCRAVANVFGV